MGINDGVMIDCFALGFEYLGIVVFENYVRDHLINWDVFYTNCTPLFHVVFYPGGGGYSGVWSLFDREPGVGFEELDGYGDN